VGSAPFISVTTNYISLKKKKGSNYISLLISRQGSKKKGRKRETFVSHRDIGEVFSSSKENSRVDAGELSVKKIQKKRVFRTSRKGPPDEESWDVQEKKKGKLQFGVLLGGWNY